MKTNINWKYISKSFLLYHLILSQFRMIGCNPPKHNTTNFKLQYCKNIHGNKSRKSSTFTYWHDNEVPKCHDSQLYQSRDKIFFVVHSSNSKGWLLNLSRQFPFKSAAQDQNDLFWKSIYWSRDKSTLTAAKRAPTWIAKEAFFRLNSGKSFWYLMHAGVWYWT